MADVVSPNAALRLAVNIAGTQAKFAAACGCGQPLISKLIRKNRPLKAELVLKAEAATGVSRHLLRPDIYPLQNDGAMCCRSTLQAPKWHQTLPGEEQD